MIKKQEDNKQWFLYPANLRTKTLLIIIVSSLVILSIFVSSYFIKDIPTSFINANQMPSLEHLFGTDWMGRDMFQRTIAGLGLSIMVGLIASIISTCISIILGLFSSFNRFTYAFNYSWVYDVWWLINRCCYGCWFYSLDYSCKSFKIRSKRN